MDTVTYGYSDDLLIGNFMKPHRVTTRHPFFSPRIAKYGGTAKVYTQAEPTRFYQR